MSDGPFGRRSEPVGESPPSDPEEAPFREPAPPAQPRGISSITWILGVLVVLALAYITLNSLRTDGPGSRGVTVGKPLPPFAAPLVDGPVGDAQVDPKKACSVKGPGVLNSCSLRATNEPVVLAFLATRSKQCEKQIDRVDQVARRVSGVQFAAVAIRGSRTSLASLKSRWTIPLAHDRDGAVSNLFAVAVCPTITFARAGGIVEHTTLGLVEEAEIERRIEALR